MAEDLDDGEFWLPPQFLTDDDILMDFTPTGSDPDSSSGTGSDPITESEEDELLSLLTHQLAPSSIGLCNAHSKGWVSSGSPKSTLCGCVGKDGSSLGSPNRPVSPPSAAAEKAEDAATATLILLNEAAGEVAKVKMRRENKAGITGTGFFDCSQLRNPPPPPKNNNYYYPPCYFPPQFRPPPQGLVWGQVQAANAPLRLPPSAWPPLQAQNHRHQDAHNHHHQDAHNHHHQNHHAVPPMFMGQPSSGTGVFLPRQVSSPTDTRKKPDVNVKKARSGKGQSKQKKGSRSSMADQSVIKLPQEWTY